jgi:hypothetical protein
VSLIPYKLTYNREHIRRVHLRPYMCGNRDCRGRWGTVYEVKRHRRIEHPDQPLDLIREQDQDNLDLKRFKALLRRGITYDRICQICIAGSDEDLDKTREPRGTRTTSNRDALVVPLSPAPPDHMAFMEVSDQISLFVDKVVVPAVRKIEQSWVSSPQIGSSDRLERVVAQICHVLSRRAAEQLQNQAISGNSVNSYPRMYACVLFLTILRQFPHSGVRCA